MGLLESVVLGLVQGLTEFLPVSSSGHLVLVKALFGVNTGGITFEVFVHFGTFLAVVSVFWKDIRNMFKSLWGRLLALPKKEGGRSTFRNDYYLRLAIFILWGSIPAAVVGLVFEDLFVSIFSNPLLVAIMLMVTGGVLFFTRFFKTHRKGFGWANTGFIGVAQALAIIPGISRSGTTIAMGFYLGITRKEAVRFSFLLALPAILGATLLEVGHIVETPIPSSQILTLLMGTAAAYLSGYVAIRVLLGVVQRGRLDRFAYYCWAVGILALFFLR
ncbi:undecaprenyl-diphosphate phosphatase [candidate division KSB1 bacterium]|nr:undecaprenyl-diphosphate phosphatase [candidate division KSB1 bacterium]